MGQLITYGFHSAPPELGSEQQPLPPKGFVTLTQLICFAIYGSALTVKQLKCELDRMPPASRDEKWGSAAMEAAIARVYEVLSDCVESSEVTLRGILIDQSSPTQRPRTAEQAQRTAIDYRDCGDLIHDLCANVLYQQSTLDDENLEDVRTWQDVAMSARDAAQLMKRIDAAHEVQNAGAASAAPTAKVGAGRPSLVKRVIEATLTLQAEQKGFSDMTNTTQEKLILGLLKERHKIGSVSSETFKRARRALRS